MIVARLIQFGKLGGFHFNDSKYGDDDLDAGSIDPYRLFLVFNELVDAEQRGAEDFHPAHMIDQSHNVTDPIESLMLSRGRGAARLCAGPAGRPQGARRLPGRQRRADGDADAEGRLPHRCRADPRHGAPAKPAAPSIRSPPTAPAATAPRSRRNARPLPAAAAVLF